LIAIDIPQRRLDVTLTPQQVAGRLRGWRKPEPRYRTGALAKYARLVTSASRGAVCR